MLHAGVGVHTHRQTVALNLGWCLGLRRLFTYHLHWILKTYTSFRNGNSSIFLLLALYSHLHPNKQSHGQFPQNSKQTRKAGWTDGLQNPVLQILLLGRLHRKGIRYRLLVQFSPNLKTLFLLKNSWPKMLLLLNSFIFKKEDNLVFYF